MEIKITNLSKKYGKKQALNNINLVIPKGMYGLLGKNGAGKTSLMRIIVTLAQPSSGSILINNIPITDVKKIRHQIGYLPQNFSMYPDMKVYEALRYLGILSGMDKKQIETRIEDLLTAVNLDAQSDDKIKTLSGGMKQRLGIAQALLNNPKVLVVDEPTAGLDPEERIRFRNLLCEVAGERIVILSTHIAQDIEDTCERVAILNNGEIAFQGSLSMLKKKAANKVYEVTVARENVKELKKEKSVLAMQSSGDGKMVQCRILSDTPPKESYRKCDPKLEDGYMQIIRGGIK